MRRHAILSLTIMLVLSGCQTTGGFDSFKTSVENKIQETTDVVSTSVSSNVASLNPFTKRERDFIRFVDEKKFSDADNLLRNEIDYFRDYFKTEDKQSVNELADYRWNKDYAERFNSTLNNLSFCGPSEISNWKRDSKSINKASSLIEQASFEPALSLTTNKNTEIEKLRLEAANCEKIYKQNVGSVLTSLADRIISRDVDLQDYAIEISETEIRGNNSVQKQIKRFIGNSDSTSMKRSSAQINSAWVSEKTKSQVDNEYLDKLEAEFESDGFTSVQEAAEFEQKKSGIFGKGNYRAPLLKVGYFDLDMVANYPKNSLPFNAKVNNDIKVPVEDLSSNYSKNAELNDYDLIFFKKILSGEIDRDFEDKNKPTSKFQSGTRQVANPAYPSAFNEYQIALRRQAEVEADSELSNSCRGTAQCLAAGFAEGIAKNVARERAQEAAKKLGNTPQTLTEPVFQNYQYRIVEVSAKKLIKIQMGVIDMRTKLIVSKIEEYRNSEEFSLVYGLHENDPNKKAIEKKYKTEDDITAWENKDITFQSSGLISNQTNVDEEVSFEGVENAKFYLEASLAKAPKEKKVPARDSEVTGVIADKRFDSVVLIKTGAGLGTGFFVDAETILTAYHVVEGHSLVRLSKFDKSNGSGRVVAHDIRLDLALIKTNMTGIPLEIYSGPIPLGAEVEAIGHPQGLEFTITRGVISALRMQESIYTEGAAQVEFVQSDTPISPGNSGGPLFLDEKVVGVADFGNVKEFSQNLNFSVSFNEVNRFLAKNRIY